MKKVLVKYNPYKLETCITIDEKKLAKNSKLGEKAANGSRLQEWVEEFPRLLIDEYNDTEFEITFHGTTLDYEDLVDMFNEASNRNELQAIVKHSPAKETSDKETLIDEVFAQIQQGPFAELKDQEIKSAFEHARSSDFEVCVVATMSAGKSTLINSMLGTKLMPSKQEACTAVVTKIKDTSHVDQSFRAEVYNNEGEKTVELAQLTYNKMEKLNAQEDVAAIHISGNIPFVSSEDVSLVLIDTPGPNNSRDPRHGKVQAELLSKSSKALVLYIMTGEFGTDDDNSLLARVAESMSVGGKQSKDRFIFVVNKLDDRKKEDGDTSQTLDRVRTYLKNHGIVNPNLFPASALPALNLRLITNQMDVDEDTIDETEVKIKKLNRNESLHFESYAALPASIRNEINEQLLTTRAEWDGRANENPQEALIHTGIISIEAAIRQYVLKYAKTAKIKNIVDTFLHKLEEVGVFENTKHELVRNQEHSDKIVELIEKIRHKLDSATEAKKFKDKVDDAIVLIKDYSKEPVEEIIQKLQSRINKRIDALRNEQLSLDDVEDEVERLQKFARKLQPDFAVAMDELVRKNIVEMSVNLIEQYKSKLISLTEELDLEKIDQLSINPLKLMNGSIGTDQVSIQLLTKEKEVEDGEEWVKNTDKKWWKPWTWPQESGYYRTTYKTVQYVEGDELAQQFFMPIGDHLFQSGEEARKYACQEAKKIGQHFNTQFDQLDHILKAKLNELENFATDKDKADERIRETENRLKWLEQIKVKVESILEI